MKKEIIKRICNEKGLINNELFIEWFSQRFPDESDIIISYVSEWIDRFLTGNPVLYMDEYSKQIYDDLKNKYSK